MRRIAFAALLVFACAGRAQADEATARAFFKRGIELYDKKQFAPALEQFQKAYAEKPSPGIKQNIALSLKALGKNVEAATAFDEAIDEGQGTLKPEVRTAMEGELVQLAKLVATIRISVVAMTDHQPFEGAVVSVDGTALSTAAAKRPIRLAPGIHTFTAHTDKFPDPPEKRLSLLAGSPVDATFEMGIPTGTLTVTPNVADAAVTVDGVGVSKSGWPLKLPAGPHHIVVTAKGYTAATADISVSAGAGVEYPITLAVPGAEPLPPYEPRKKPPPKPVKSRYLVPGLAYEGQSFRLSELMGEHAGGAKRQFSGGAISVRGGYHLSRFFALELYGDIGEVGATYTIDGAISESNTKVVQFQIAPGARFTTSGALRLTLGSYFGPHGQLVTAHTVTGIASNTLKGDGVSVSWLTDAGLQFDAGSLFLELVFFLDVHGVGTTTDDQTGARMFYSSPSTRAGGRIGLGIPF